MNLHENIHRIKEVMGIINEYECKYCDDRTRKNIATLSAELQPIANQFIDKVKETTGKTLTITDGLRTFQQQDMLYCKGRPKDSFCAKKRLPTGGNIVTNRKGGEGNHNYGNSFDVYFNNGGKIDVKGDITPDVAKIGKDLGLVWGGDFTTIQDAPHFELPKKG
jgi:peptidoglycan L-alanyl-D-glutamate endopeptidase CwlK